MNKTFVMYFFGRPEPWIDKYIKEVGLLAKDNWNWLMFTDNDMPNTKNFKTVKMDLEGFKDKIQEKFGVRPNYNLTNNEMGFCLSYAPALGYMFSDYLKDVDFWGYTNLDVVYGDLSHYLPDKLLKTIDIFGNDPDDTCGPFTLLRNTKEVNELFLEAPDWPICLTDGGNYGFDEQGFSRTVKKARDEKRLKVKFEFWQSHGYNPKLHREGKKLFDDLKGEEIMMFHFNREKKWPL